METGGILYDFCNAFRTILGRAPCAWIPFGNGRRLSAPLLRNYSEPDNGRIEFTKEFVMAQLGDHLNRHTNTILRDVSAINGFLDFVNRKGFYAYKIPPKSIPKEVRNFKAYIFSDDEIGL